MSAFTAAPFEQFETTTQQTPAWVRNDNISVYDLNVPNRVVRGNYSATENNLASPKAQRQMLGLVGGNEVSRMAGNPQDIESDLRGITRPLTNCPGREYSPANVKNNTLYIDNRKTNLNINIQPVHLPEMQMWAYPGTYAPLPLVKETCGQPHKY